MSDKNIHQRLHAVMEKVSYIQKEKKNGMQYTIVSHDKVTALVRPHLVEQRVIYYPIDIQHSQNGNRTEVRLVLRFANIDKPEDHIDVHGLGYGIDQQDKGPGKATSYAVKYCLLKALGLETGDDPEHDSIDHQPDASASETYSQMALKAIEMAQTPDDLKTWWTEQWPHINALPEAMAQKIIKAKDARKQKLTKAA